MGTLDGQIAADEQSVVNEESMRDGSSGDLASTKELLKDIQPGCDWIRTHFAARKASRGAEIIGLEAAKKALEDAELRVSQIVDPFCAPLRRPDERSSPRLLQGARCRDR